MALTIITQPSTIQSAYNTILLEVSTNSTDPIFNYYFEIKDMAGVVLSTNRFPKRPNGRVLFDVSKIVQNKVSYDISGLVENKLGIYPALNTHFQFYVDIYEESGTTYANVTKKNKVTTNNITIVNSAFEYLDTLATSYLTDYQNTPVTTAKFLTEMQGGYIRVRENQAFELGMIQTLGSTSLAKVEIKTYDSLGTLIQTATIINSYANTGTLANIFLSLNVGVDSLNSQTLATGSQPLITDNVATYSIVQKSASAETSEPVYFEVDRGCSKFTPIHIYWLNKIGRIDSYSFNFAQTKTSEVEKEYYNKPTLGYAPTSYNGGRTIFSNRNRSKQLIRTDYLNNIESQWIEGFMKSSMCWAYIDNKFVTIKVNTKNYEIKDIQQNSMFIQEFEIELGFDNFRQTL